MARRITSSTTAAPRRSAPRCASRPGTAAPGATATTRCQPASPGRRAAETVVLASAEKLGVASAYVIAPVTEASGLVVERVTPDAATAPYAALGLAITRA